MLLSDCLNDCLLLLSNGLFPCAENLEYQLLRLRARGIRFFKWSTQDCIFHLSIRVNVASISQPYMR